MGRPRRDLNIENAQLAAGNAELRREIARLQRRLASLEAALDHERRDQARTLERLAVAQREIATLRSQVKHYAQLLFGRKSEQGALPGAPPGDQAVEGTPSQSDQAVAPSESTERTARGKRGQVPGTPGHGRRFGRGLPTVEHRLTEGVCCARCGTAYVPLPGVFAASTVVDWVTLVVSHRYLRQKYLRDCTCEDQPRMRTAKGPDKIRAKGAFSPRFLARLCVEKFELARPANKVCQSLRLEGAILAPGTVSGLYEHALYLLLPLAQEIYAYVRGQQHAHADETGYTVLDEQQQRRRWWLWVVAVERAVAFVLDPHRSAAVLQHFYGWAEETPPPSHLLTLVSDALPTYTKLVGWIRQALCWAHQRRRFRDVGRAHPALASWAEQWRMLIVRLYQLHRARRKAAPDTSAWVEADTALRAHVAHMRTALDQQLRRDDLHPDQRRALVHLQQRWAGYTTFLDDPKVPLDNNLSERLLRLAVLLRKNANFIGADWAATFAAVLWSVLATAGRNDLNPLTYLTAYFQACAEHGGHPLQGGALKRFLPWALNAEDKARWSAPLPPDVPADLVIPASLPAPASTSPAVQAPTADSQPMDNPSPALGITAENATHSSVLVLPEVPDLAAAVSAAAPVAPASGNTDQAPVAGQPLAAPSWTLTAENPLCASNAGRGAHRRAASWPPHRRRPAQPPRPVVEVDSS